MSVSGISPFDKELLMDTTVPDHILREQLEAFVRMGYTGSDLVKLILHTNKPGIATHVSRLLSLVEECLNEL